MGIVSCQKCSSKQVRKAIKHLQLLLIQNRTGARQDETPASARHVLNFDNDFALDDIATQPFCSPERTGFPGTPVCTIAVSRGSVSGQKFVIDGQTDPWNIPDTRQRCVFSSAIRAFVFKYIYQKMLLPHREKGLLCNICSRVQRRLSLVNSYLKTMTNHYSH